jgi:hypothetical protein
VIKKIAPTIENRMLLSLDSLKVAGTMLGWELRGCSERQKSPHNRYSGAFQKRSFVARSYL